MVAPSSKPIMWTVIIATIIVLYAGFMMVNSIKDSMPETPVMPSAEAIAGAVLLNVNIPTAAEIAALVEVPEVDTFYSVQDKEKSIAEDLATDELSDRDFREEVAEDISSNCDGTDIERKDITSISVRDSDVRLHFGDSATVELELKVYYDNYGDDEESENSRIIVEFEIDNLDRNDDYEDAEVDGFSIEDFKSCTTD